MRQRSRQTERLDAPWLKAKYVDAPPFYAKGGYSPMNGASLPRNPAALQIGLNLVKQPLHKRTIPTRSRAIASVHVLFRCRSIKGGGGQT
jgi:hypothetical protein